MSLIDPLSSKLSSYLEPNQVKKVIRAYRFAEQCHQGQYRQSGDPYITHPVAVAHILADMHMDHESLMASLLHDVIEDTSATKGQISRRFGKTVAELVDGVSKLTEIEFSSKAEQQAENFQKMTLAMAKDIRVVLVKLADRLHNMRTLGVLNPKKKRRIARETLEIYAPIAQRLGMNDIRVEFEELGFDALHPLRSRRMREARKAARGHRTELLSEIKQTIELELSKEKIDNEVSGREKHLWSIYQKMVQKKKSFKEIMDVFAFRIVVDSVDNCYRVLGLIHNLFKPVPGEFKDYIAIPKSNGYQSLHTVLVGMHGVPIEVQIRTRDMDAMANYGIAAHWLYKASDDETPLSTHSRAGRWVQGLLELQQHAGNPLEFIEHVKTDLFPDEIYVFTPKGKIIELPSGATPVDFAYAVHTDVGNRCIACELDGHLASLSEPLQSGQKVRIITAKSAQPNPTWLNFVITAKARSAVRHFLKKQEHQESVTLGKKLLDRALENFGSSYPEIRKSWVKRLLKATDAPSFEFVLQQIGLGERMAFAVANLMLPPSKRKKEQANIGSPVLLDTNETMLISYGRCCRPIPGDPILGHLSSGRGLVIHRESCGNLANIRNNLEKSMPVKWSPQVKGEFPVECQIEVISERGIVATLAARITEQDATIDQISISDQSVQLSTIKVLVGVRDRIHLANILRRIRSLSAVRRVTRIKN
ncbi:bifunctional (p)ppGpp synthetase/guanosine-3',5'-bis(diphosphate) 3'-pyrophosphohydrolase [Porticoccus sp. W117]|uniref:RelA/SpoT family protein n=1 Tax=Porticoccus sp. W117 TaxID=3054777 RepID=UPI00259706A2|nr:bifunctional (p)ppGpp synthetase/guanosine-3',5'-bis(diphosphate) 3'-pyrophosphohydrolase [Porticoccus sp. W117]MDM3870530.1 bifunctional (p)ppGpp synthetase/guanosine-3',5'-bis(diphosphate) 3'-pyrophosphohydrolase [Porticoccus sp. W117]